MAFIQTKDFGFVEISDEKLTDIVKDKFVIALDFDGVVTAPYKLKTYYLNQLGYKLTEEQSSAISCLKLNVTKEHHEYATKKAFTTPPKELPLEKDFLKYFKKLQKGYYKIFLITSRTEDMLEHLERYLKYHKLRFDGIINTKNKSKTEALRKIRAKIFVEDSPFKIKQMLYEDHHLIEKCFFVIYRNKQNLMERSPNGNIFETNNWKKLYYFVLSKSGNLGYFY